MVALGGGAVSYERGTPVHMHNYTIPCKFAHVRHRGVKLERQRKVDIRLPGKGEFKLPWRKAGLLKSSR